MFELDKNSPSDLLIKITNINNIYDIMIKKKEVLIKHCE